ncbi:diaminopimelate decarboxylase [Terriglobus roseus DSM 18391]|uniref:Diaminopimelate decarboxylase n=1 Tax=Terriglobus roseus (strain DSM 18391 / NRRL B-41598 / KBS 63) TaxID=926566 RepID=I3ZHK6_TERRK|nr:diaminopimelate decarboxylase [Terriglobus roseus]AFL88384.1 diaminopimelate decarboxylase [Terriglobus roseus DSM 18391]AFL88724.1 diaminopimelate decarboxylase [Terriglobus roseus DSM 18391]
MNQGRPFVYADARLKCDGVDVAELAEQFGTPLYVYSANQIAERAGLFQTAFAGVSHTVCYAVKANSSLAILKMLAAQGCGFDIVSGGELARVLAAGGRDVASRVVFSGVGKTAAEMDEALDAEILQFNVESEPELELLAARAAAKGKRARIALRVNPDVSAETHPYISTGLSAHKFGIGIKLARAVYTRAAAMPSIETTGVSVHIGSQIRQVEPFAEALAKTLALVAELRSDGHQIRYVDAGGGLGIEYADKDFDAAEQVAHYAAALKSALGSMDVHLLLEPGRFLVGQAGALITRVLYRKQNGDKKFVIVDAGMNDLIRPALYQAHHEIVPVVTREGSLDEEADIVGPVCESGDFFARARTLPVSEDGDLLAVLDAGAYGLSLSSNYNTRLRPAEVLVESTGARLVRRRETYEELFAPEMP